MISTPEKALPLFKRLWIYQRERFNIPTHLLLISTFCFSACSYSIICSGNTGFIDLDIFIIGALTSFCFFFLLRIFDEFKDYEKDLKYQPYRAVPRGLVTLQELRNLAIFIVVFQIIINALFIPVMLYAISVVMAYMYFMTKEFFIKEWLTARPISYTLSHMVIMPLIDFYATGLDWLIKGNFPPPGLTFFLVVTFLNGLVIETGRKIRSTDTEEFGVQTYSSLFGYKKATLLWLSLLLTTYIVAQLACNYAGYGQISWIVLTLFLILFALPGLFFIQSNNSHHAKFIEYSSGLWTICMYLTLGGIPMVYSLVKGI